jgi:beta-lactamase regulating signal transducer with metallopeptidase domain
VTFLPRLIVVALSTFAVVNIVASLTLLFAWRPPAGTATVRSRVWFQGRMIPATLSVLATAIAVSGFLRYEPREGLEDMSFLLVVFAAMTVAIWVIASVRLIRTALSARRAMRKWMPAATPIELRGIAARAFVVNTAFPIVAVVGLFRPRLLVARAVLDECSESEMRAILAHESWHLVRGDNFRRVLLSAAPDVLSWLPRALWFSEEWQLASEEAADDAAARRGPAGRVQLAQALVRVARLAGASDRDLTTMLPASALYRGDSIEHRVRRILDSTLDVNAGRRTWRVPLAVIFSVVFVLSALNLAVVQNLIEMAVQQLP